MFAVARPIASFSSGETCAAASANSVSVTKNSSSSTLSKNRAQYFNASSPFLRTSSRMLATPRSRNFASIEGRVKSAFQFSFSGYLIICIILLIDHLVNRKHQNSFGTLVFQGFDRLPKFILSDHRMHRTPTALRERQNRRAFYAGQ